MHNYKLRLLIRKYILRKYAPFMKGFYKEFKSLISQKILFLTAMLTNAVKLAYTSLVVVIILSMFGIETSFLLVLGINAVTLLTNLIPFSFSGIGIKEATAVFLFYSLGYDPVIISTLYVVITIVYLILNSASLIYFINTNQIKK